MYLGVRGAWKVEKGLEVPRIFKEQGKSTYLCKLVILYKQWSNKTILNFSPTLDIKLFGVNLSEKLITYLLKFCVINRGYQRKDS